MDSKLWKSFKGLATATVIAGLTVFASPALALVIVTISYEGTVTKVGSDLTGGPINLDDKVTGQVSYTAPATDGDAGGTRGLYPSISAHTYQAGTYSGDITNLNSGNVSIFNDFDFCSPGDCPSDGLTADTSTSSSSGLGAGDPIAGMQPQRVQLALGFTSTALLSSDALLDEVADFSVFTTGSWFLIFGSTGSTTSDIRATIDSFSVSVTQVPEPHGLALLSLGLVAFALSRRRRIASTSAS